jgi:hypothetical protein
MASAPWFKRKPIEQISRKINQNDFVMPWMEEDRYYLLRSESRELRETED